MKKSPKKKRDESRSPGDYPPEATVGNQALRGWGAVPDEGSIKRRIAEKAYELYEKRGMIHGDDLDDWLEAEQHVTAELQGQADLQRPKRRRRGSKKR